MLVRPEGPKVGVEQIVNAFRKAAVDPLMVHSVTPARDFKLHSRPLRLW